MICRTPFNHVRNLDAALNNSDGPLDSPNSVTATKRPPPPINHNIQILTAAFQDAILENDIFELTAVNLQYSLAMRNDLDFLKYDRSELKLTHKQAQQILNAHTAASTPILASPPNGLTHSQPTPPPSASFKPPKLDTDKWGGISYNFYPWLSSILNGFNLTKCNDPVKLIITLQAIPLNKRGSFNNITLKCLQDQID